MKLLDMLEMAFSPGAWGVYLRGARRVRYTGEGALGQRQLWLDSLSVLQISFVLPGPEQPLVDGVEEHFRKGNCT